LIVLSVLYEAILVSLDTKLGLYMKESVSSVVEEVTLISSNENLGRYTLGPASAVGVDGETIQW